MMILRLLFLLLLCSCSDHSNEKLHTFSANVMTIDYKIMIGHALSTSEKRIIQQEIDQTFDEINSIYNKWNPQSEVSKLNRLRAEQKVSLSPQLTAFFKKIDEIYTLTEGRYDPTVEPLSQLWKKQLNLKQIPSEEQLSQLMQATGWEKIHIDDGLFWKEHEATTLDLGGSAKGYAVDLLIERLSKRGYKNLFVEWGGEIKVLGEHPDQRPWQIYISRLSDNDPAHAIAHLALRDQAIATSGDYLQNWAIKQRNEKGEESMTIYFHIIDPRSGKALKATHQSIASATVLASNCMLADALATAAMLFSSTEEAENWATRLKQKIPTLSFWLVTREGL